MSEGSERGAGCGTVVAVCVSERKGTRKHAVERGEMRPGHGLVGDAHAAGWHRQVSLLATSSIAKMRCVLPGLAPGDFAENLTVEGLEVARLAVGTHLRVGREVELEVTQIGKECHLGCEIRRQVGDCVMPREGVFARVLRGGVVRPGDAVEVVEATA